MPPPYEGDSSPRLKPGASSPVFGDFSKAIKLALKDTNGITAHGVLQVNEERYIENYRFVIYKSGEVVRDSGRLVVKYRNGDEQLIFEAAGS